MIRPTIVCLEIRVHALAVEKKFQKTAFLQKMEFLCGDLGRSCAINRTLADFPYLDRSSPSRDMSVASLSLNAG